MSTLAELVTLEHIALACPATSSDAVIRTLAAMLESSGHVKPGYADACIRREVTDPTGLPTEGAAVAIPHADPDLVVESGIAVAVPIEPVRFAQMGDPEIEIQAEVVFLLALTGPQEQVLALRQVALFVQDPARMRALVAADDPAQVRAMFIAHEEEINE